jgi:hypothetical protein
MSYSVPLLILALVIVAIVGLRYRRRAGPDKRRKPSVSGFAWAVMFLGSGRMPPPPPQSQIEQEAGEKKNREISRDGIS